MRKFKACLGGSGTARIVMAFILFVSTLIGTMGPVLGQRESTTPNYPQSLETSLQTLLRFIERGEPDAGVWTQLAETYMDLADDLLTDEEKRQRAYQEGAKAAQHAFELQDSNAQAHFLYAANLGSAERIKGLTNAAMKVQEIKQHVARAIELDPTHAQALQMMGGLFMELPWFLGGDEKKAQEYLERAIAADGNFTNARMLLAKLYKKQDRIEEAKKQLEAVIHTEHPHYAYTWVRKFKPEAEKLLNEMIKARPAAR